MSVERRRGRKREWRCRDCEAKALPIEPRHLIGSAASVCPQCLGRGVERVYDWERVIVRPDVPLAAGVFGGSLAWFRAGRAGITGFDATLAAIAERHRFAPAYDAVVGDERRGPSRSAVRRARQR